MERTHKHEYLGMIADTFHELPGWQKFIVVFAIVAASPALAILAGLMSLSMFPLLLAGRFEGDMGPAPFTDDLAKRVHEQQARTHRYYAH
jgi:hypothetical protein